MKCAFLVPGEPMPWMRAGRDGRSGRTYTPREMEEFQAKVKLCAKASGVMPTIGTVEVLVVSYLSVDPLGKMAGDWDNYAKNVCDALRGVAFRDDKQIVRGIGVKLHDEKCPRTEVMIRSVDPKAHPFPDDAAQPPSPTPKRGLSPASYPPRP